MAAESVKHASFLIMASVVILTSVLSLKGLGNTTGVSKIEAAILNNNNSAKSRMHDPEKKRDSHVRANFVLCRNCFWCTSHIRRDMEAFDNCPICRGDKLENLPICLGESYSFGCSSGSVNLAFRKD